MPFSASTCLSYLGSTPLGPTFKVYTNPTSPTNPGTYLMDVPTSSITGGNCPYTFIVPDGTTTVRLFDPVSFCYADVPISSNNVCTTCNLKFDSLTNNALATIYVGNLTGSCDTTIDNYRIEWYGPNSTTNLAFTSGKGTLFPYTYQQPITSGSTSSPFLLPGNYVSKITDVELNGVKFSYTGGTNNILSPSLFSCSTGATVTTYSCVNGPTPPLNPPYAHTRSYTSDGSLNNEKLETTFTLGANTPFFIWSLTTYSYYDTLSLIFSGSSYPVPITLENLKMGNDVSPQDLLPTTFPKTYQLDTEFKKITTLTGLTVNAGDTITIKIDPNLNYATSWNLKFGCSTTPTASKTCLDSYKNTPYKIKTSSISASTVDSCGRVSVGFKVSGCSTTENNGFINSTLVSGTTSVTSLAVSTSDSDNKLLLTNNNFQSGTTTYIRENGNFASICTTAGFNSGNIRVYKDDVNTIKIVCSNLDDLASFYNTFNTTKNSTMTSPSAYNSDPTNINYYRFITLRLIANSGNFSCGDTIITQDKLLHCTSTCVTGGTGPYTMTIQQALISNQYTLCTSCDTNCGYFSSLTNTSITDRNTFFDFSNTSRGRQTAPFNQRVAITKSTTPATPGQQSRGYIQIYPNYSTKTYASSGTTNTLIPSLSGQSWDWQNHFAELFGNGGLIPYYMQDVYYYETRVITYAPLVYEIWAYTISNFKISGTLTKIYDSITGIVSGQSGFFV